MNNWECFGETVRAGLAAMHLNAGDEQIRQMERFAVFLEEQNKVMNLTAITQPDKMALLHFLDSAALLGAADFEGKRVIDVGTGAGVPGLPLKLLRPSISLFLLDSQRKRVDFLNRAAALLGISDVTCVQARAEEQSRLTGFRDAFDLAVSRAVADLRVLTELCLPFVRVGGRFLAMKSMDSHGEIQAAERAIARLGGKLLPSYSYTLSEELTRRVVVVEKIAPTPGAYPRRFAKIQKELL